MPSALRVVSHRLDSPITCSTKWWSQGAPASTSARVVAGLQILFASDTHVWHRRIATDTTLDKISHWMIQRFLFSDRAFKDQRLERGS